MTTVIVRLWNRVGPRNNVLDGVQIPPYSKAIWEGKGQPVVKYREFLLWAVHKRLNRWGMDSGGTKEASVGWHALRRNVTNTIEPSMWSRDVAFSSLTTRGQSNLMKRQSNYFDHLLLLQEGQHPLTGQRAANFRLLANQWSKRRLVTQWCHGCRAMRRSVCNAGAVL